MPFLPNISAVCLAQIIPANRRVSWQASGYDGILPNPTTVLNVMNYGAVGNGIADDAPALNACIAALTGGSGVVYLPTGTYRLTSTINLPSGVVLRGAGETTLLKLDLSSSGQNGINISGTNAGAFVSVSSGYTVNSSDLVLSASPTQFSAGIYAELVQDNNPAWDTQPASWAAQSKGQIVRVLSVSGNTLHLQYPLRTSYDEAYNVRIRPLTPVRRTGVECLYIERLSDPTGSGGGSNIFVNTAVNCWVKGVHSNKSVGPHIAVFASSDLEITGNYLHDAFDYSGTSARGYGVMLAHHTGQCLIVDNIFKHLRHAMSVKQGANGNVLAYNYSYDGYRSEFPNDFASDISLHGHYAYANLFEGNISELLWIDDAWGATGPYNTYFRNRFTKYGLYMTSAGSNGQNFVGNEITSTALFQGLYTLSGSDHFQHGNNKQGTILPTGTNTLNDTSYFFDQTPSFWTSGLNFPPIGIPNTINSNSIPAKNRNNATLKTICPIHPTPVRIKAKAFLEGAYIGIQTMHNNLRSQNLLPFLQPFDQTPYMYKGFEGFDSPAQMPSNMVDWVLLEVRSSSNLATVLEQRAAILLSDGSITDIDGNPDGVAFYQITQGNAYRLSIRARGHLPLASASSITLPNTASPFDFGNANLIQGGVNQLSNNGGQGLLPVGDTDANGVINVSDFNFCANNNGNNNLYSSADCNADGNVNLSDINVLLTNCQKMAVPALR